VPTTVPPKSKSAGFRIGDCRTSVNGTSFGELRQAVSATVGLNVVGPGLVEITCVFGLIAVPISLVWMINGTIYVATLALPPPLNGSWPTITPVYAFPSRVDSVKNVHKGNVLLGTEAAMFFMASTLSRLGPGLNHE
jgi:hypothetical protein